MSLIETCLKCGKAKPVALILRDKEDQYLCVDCAPEWLESDEQWPPLKT